MGKLTALKVSSLKKRGYHGDGGGLYLQVSEWGTKSWIFRYRVDDKLRNHGLGAADTVTLAEARDAAKECRKLRLKGIDPIEENQQQKIAAKLEAAQAITFSQCAEEYIDVRRAGWKNKKHAQQWVNTLTTYAFPVIGELPVAAVNLDLIVRVLRPIWHTKTETASRVRQRIEAVLGWATIHNYRTGLNPATWKGNLDKVFDHANKVKQPEHHPALSHAELSQFWGQLSEYQTVAAQALRFTILTAARTSEVLEAKWDEIDLDSATWSLSALRMKAKKGHRVPLSPQAVALLEEMLAQRKGEYIFPGQKEGRPLSNMSMLYLLKKMERTDITVHGFRSTFRDWVGECTEVAGEVAEAALAHAVKNKAEAAYRRTDFLDKRRNLMEKWAGYCTGGSS